jgi:Na+/proline symporter
MIAPRWNKTKAITAAQYITERLGYNTQKLYTYLFLFISIFTTGAFLYPVAKIVEVSTGIPIAFSIIGLGLIITIYTAIGGLWAVIVTDVLQFIVLTAAVLIVVPLAFEQVDGVDNFIKSSPEGFFNLVNTEYTWVFIVAMTFYHIVFIGGNWAYVQRYTSVANPREAKKVGWVLSGLYLISPIIWMLPPMIYRTVNPDLSGLADEGAYLMICKEVLPTGLLGLMLGGMIFATSSSVNTTLNILAGVFTNDVFKRIYKNADEKLSMRVARYATFGFGLITIIIALFVPKMGGIVEVVLSVAAITGGAMFLPPIWALFSKRQTGKIILSITIISLSVNVFFKFITPELFDFSLSRSSEMMTGVLVPLLLLIAAEIFLSTKKDESIDYEKYQKILKERTQRESEIGNDSNVAGRKIIASGILAIGILMCGLGVIADYANMLVITMGVIITVVAALIFPWSKK